MRRLFQMECGKILRSPVYWISILVLVFVFAKNYGSIAEEEIRLASDPSSLFYTAEEGGYAPERESILTSEARQDIMMRAAVKKLLYSYRRNSYEYYPFGYYKEKVMSDREQAVIAAYLTEMTGMDEQELLAYGNRGAEKPVGEPEDGADRRSGELPISGEDAFILDAGEGHFNEDGQFIIEPGSGKSVRKDSNPGGREGIQTLGVSDAGKAYTVKSAGKFENGTGRWKSEFLMSEGDQFILEPGEGYFNENGQFIIEPGNGNFVGDDANSNGGEGKETESGNDEKGGDEQTEGTEGKETESGSDEKGGGELTDGDEGKETESGSDEKGGGEQADGTEGKETESGSDEKGGEKQTDGNEGKETENGSTGNSGSSGTEKPSGQELKVQVTFQRFREIMDSVNGMIGKNSYFSWPMLDIYYGDNDTGMAPVTWSQHNDFLQKDRITGAFARYYCDCLSLVLLCIPAFVMADLILRDKRSRMREMIAVHSIPGYRLLSARYLASVSMIMIPVLALPVKSLFVLVRYGVRTGNPTDLLAFVKYGFGWLLPTVMFVSAVGLLITVLTENYLSVLAAGALWLFGKPSVGKLTGGNYEITDLIIRHNTLKGYDRMEADMEMLIQNRLAVTAAALVLAALAILIYEKKRKGGLQLGFTKFSNCIKNKWKA